MIKDVNLAPKRKKHPRFTFINALVDVPDFRDVVSSRWNVEIEGKLMQKLWNKLKILQPILKGMIKHWTEELLNNTDIEEKIMMQNSKVNWLKLGDGSNAYFHAIVKEKNKQNGLHRLENNQDKILGEFKDIENEIIQFYQELIRTNTQNLMHVDVEVLRRATQLEENHRE
ncbi:unnamed protein product [Lathyrus sativus]|nr:unnamed protein product [Lathyrus sativus]